MIHLVCSDRNRILQDFVDFHQIEVHRTDLWDCNHNRLTVTKCLPGMNHVLCIDTDVLETLLKDPDSRSEFVSWLQINRILVTNDVDSYHNIKFSDTFHALTEIQQMIPNHHVILHVDAVPDIKWQSLDHDKYWIRTHPSFHLQMLRTQAPGLVKKKCDYHFMITAIDKPNRPHRRLFVDKLNQHPDLTQASQISFRSDRDRYSTWLGQCHNFGVAIDSGGWPDGCPSMDLYLKSWWEVVPETFSDGSLYVTEKTIKAIATMTPFLTVASQWQLRYLRQLGFQTFSPIIDETYDREPDLERRIDLIINTMQCIQSQNPNTLYQKVLPMLQHNHRHLARLSGLRTFNNDQFYHACLRDLQQVDQ